MFIPRVFLSLENNEIKVDEQSINEFNEKHITLKKNYSRIDNKKFKNKYHRPNRKFNPNDYLLIDWMNLGLSEKQANVILKFAAYGIDNNKELQQIFVIPKELFELIKDSTFYPVNNIQKEKKEFLFKNENPIVLVEINSASAQDLEKIPGIGNYFSKKIIDFRTKLGGFYSNSQLLEINKITPDKLQSIEKYILLETNLINKLSINEATVEELNAHPYIDWNLANSIVKFRQQHGYFSNFKELFKLALMDNELFNKIKHYITL
jgi:DNA uptake protein ComE-like DNA-binding protein